MCVLLSCTLSADTTAGYLKGWNFRQQPVTPCMLFPKDTGNTEAATFRARWQLKYCLARFSVFTTGGKTLSRTRLFVLQQLLNAAVKPTHQERPHGQLEFKQKCANTHQGTPTLFPAFLVTSRFEVLYNNKSAPVCPLCRRLDQHNDWPPAHPTQQPQHSRGRRT